jgi:hypothetical protein
MEKYKMSGEENLYEVSRKAEPDKLQVFRTWPI